MMIRRAAIDSCGGFDESFFLFSEETELCWRFRQHGWRVAWLPHVTVIHHESASAGQNVPLRQIRFDTSRVRLAERMYGNRAGQVVRIALLCEHLIELGIETAKWLVGHRRELRRERIRLYRRVLASRLRGSHLR